MTRHTNNDWNLLLCALKIRDAILYVKDFVTSVTEGILSIHGRCMASTKACDTTLSHNQSLFDFGSHNREEVLLDIKAGYSDCQAGVRAFAPRNRPMVPSNETTG